VSAASAGERLGEPGVAVDLDQQRREMDLRKPRGYCLGERAASAGTCSAGSGDTIRSPFSPIRAQ